MRAGGGDAIVNGGAVAPRPGSHASIFHAAGRATHVPTAQGQIGAAQSRVALKALEFKGYTAIVEYVEFDCKDDVALL